MAQASARSVRPRRDDRLLDTLTTDARRLRALQRELERTAGEARGKVQAELEALLAQSQAVVVARRAALPRPEFAADLPVNERRADIAALIAAHQVVIVCGETGSGKTTQLPKICLDLGIGARGLIGHTQPRRLAARSVAARLAQELKTQVGAGVGVKIRFQDRTGPESWVKLMTDGILLAESQSDPFLNAYEAILIDEAHERSLNIDFLLGYLKQLLPRRPDLKVIITSATIDAERFARHFAVNEKPAPVIEVSGRLYPVEIRHRPVVDIDERDDERDLYDAIVDAADELARLGPGDILVFLPGEREIREAAEALRKHALARPGLSTAHAPEILPLFSRLSAGEQDRIFKPSGGQRRIVLATNVAETSLTVPGIRYVIDTGLARVKRYSWRNKVEQLQIEKISQAAARQRAGRCGRVAAGVCIRLYDELDFNTRPLFTDPEILRSSLAGVILRMKSLRLTDVDSFPFLESPPAKAIADGYALLQELGALNEADSKLTRVGEALARLPLDPRIGRMLVAARDLGCLREVLVIAAGLSTQDPRERPQERQQAADEKHKLFADEKSEFLGWWKLWNWFRNAVEHKKSNKQLVDTCHAHFLSYLRLREWREVHGQLHAMVAELGWKENEEPGSYEAIHMALLSGLLGNIGCKADESGYYLGARGIRFLIHPSSPLQKKAGKWLMAAEITETTRLFGRCIARIEEGWIEKVGAHLIKRQYFDPHWEKKAMQVAAWERTTLYGVVINPKRRIHYGPLAPAESREIFIRQGLVGEEIDEAFARRWPFFQHNQKQIRDIEKIEHKQRRQDVLVDDELIFAFYDQRIPEGIHNGATFDHWRKEAEQENPRLLFLDKDDLMRHSAAGVTTEAFPHQIKVGGVEYALTYHFEPGSPRDGVTLTLPLAQLNQIPAPRMEWLVPGLLKEKLVQLIKTLPQKIRAKLVPVPEFVDEFIAATVGNERKMNQGLIPPLIDYILEARGLNARGWAVTPDAFRPDALPSHFSMNYKLIDEHGRQLDMNRSLLALRGEWGREAKEEFAELHETPAEYTRLSDWTFGELPELMEVPVGGQTVIGYPALVDDGDTVSLKVFDSAEEAADCHRRGLRRLFMLQFREQVKYFDKNVPGLTQMAMQYMSLGSSDELKRQLIELSFERACLSEPLPTTAAVFKARCAEAKARLGLIMQEICRLVGTVLGEWQAVSKKLPACKAHVAAVVDIEAQLKRLLGKQFVVDTPFERLQHYPRYLKAIAVRLDKLKANPVRDGQLMAEYVPLWSNYERRAIQLAKLGTPDPQVEQFRWLLEELRVGLYAQELRTPVPVSTKRLQKQWEGIKNG
ncbi:ATP-dependent RNA helicase HrpA [Azonexus sp.]|uniref:ATP-dependent RNA helicase HrpA n=1 Tax=Azonexus sp. TaxID=1872668 RepID=UPI00281D424F|nr:ATP-dependent RNA helicase HrpA [Azonexus sp.]MDR1996314.1 ATP-dependent RNA helicase HrpA [Azonexus sp.]